MNDLIGKFFKGPWVLFFILTLLCGCPITSGTNTGNPGSMANQGTGTGNPDNIGTTSQIYVSALPDPIYPGSVDPSDLVPDSVVVVYPDIFRSINNILFVTGAGRGMQIVDMPSDSTPIVRGNLYIAETHKDISLSDGRAALLTDSSFKTINIEDRDQPFVEESIIPEADVFGIFSYASDFIRLSRRSDGNTEVDLVPEEEMDQPVTSGLVLPIQSDSAKLYENRLWLRGRSSANGKDYLMGIDLEKLSLVQELLDFSEIISASSGSTPLPDPDSPIFAMTEIPATDLAKDLYMASSYPKTMEMQYGIWMEIPLYAVIADSSLYIYELNKNGELSSVIPISFQPESFFLSGSTLCFSYLHSVDAPEGEDPTKSYSQFFYHSFDLSDPSSPVESGEVNIPGTLLSLTEDQIFTLDFSWNADGDLIETVKSGQVIENSVIVTGEYPLPQRTTNRLVSGSSVITVLLGDAQEWSERIRIIDFSDPENPVEVWN